ncbi:MAG TPA: hypothetical protein PKJ34_13335 [Anaerolineaceae bacterium]|nr:hypothetical protein [Anaerolineaceae bacterium]HOH21341.1 hypothetical protein [Anaerolineaceae bacterium]
METAAIKATQDVAAKGIRLLDSAVKKAWSIMDAASEKQRPSDILGQKTIRSIQGFGS